MSRYVYKCSECENKIMVFHSINDRLEICTECDGKLERIPTGGFLLNTDPSNQKNKPGNILKEFIEDTKEEMKQEKFDMKNREHK